MSAYTHLQERCHIYWQKQSLLILLQILSIYKLSLANTIGVFLAERIERGVGFIT